MNELRWILLVAGALLIAGIYAWGMRSRQRGSSDREPRRPAVFTGSATSFETSAGAGGDECDDVGVAVESREARRLEPSVTLDEAIESTPAIERRGDFSTLADEVEVPVVVAPSGRREPSFGARTETLGTHHFDPIPEMDTVEVAPDLRRGGSSQRHEAIESPPASPTPASAPATAAEPVRPKRPPQKIFALRVVATGGGRFQGDRVLDSLHAEGLRFGRYDVFHRLHDDGRPVFSVASLKEPGTFDLDAMHETQYPGVLVFSVLPGPVAAGEAFDEMMFAARALATQLGGALADDKGGPLTAQRAGQLRTEALEFERSLAGA